MAIMGIHAGDHITYCLMPRMESYRATVFSIDGTGIVLQLPDEAPTDFSPGQYLMISEPEEDIDYYSEVAGREGSTLRLKRMWTGKRGFFRVDDVFPVLYRQVSGGAQTLESKIFSGYSAEITDEDFAQVFTEGWQAAEHLLEAKTLAKLPSFFEFLTAAAFLHFARAGVEFAVLEVGMGGRLDATNVT